jgi:hypothetical protein
VFNAHLQYDQQAGTAPHVAVAQAQEAARAHADFLSQANNAAVGRNPLLGPGATGQDEVARRLNAEYVRAQAESRDSNALPDVRAPAPVSGRAPAPVRASWAHSWRCSRAPT